MFFDHQFDCAQRHTDHGIADVGTRVFRTASPGSPHSGARASQGSASGGLEGEARRDPGGIPALGGVRRHRTGQCCTYLSPSLLLGLVQTLTELVPVTGGRQRHERGGGQGGLLAPLPGTRTHQTARRRLKKSFRVLPLLPGVPGD